MRTDRAFYLMDLAVRAAEQTTCIRAGVGCVLADARGRVLSIAYNGVAAGMAHCSDVSSNGLCTPLTNVTKERARHMIAESLPHVSPSSVKWLRLEPDTGRGTGKIIKFGWAQHACKGHDLPPGQDSCEAVHAEQNALVQCRDPDLIHTAYVTRMPCPNCTKLLLNTGCQRIVFLHPHNGKSGQELWQKAGREWSCLTPTPG